MTKKKGVRGSVIDLTTRPYRGWIEVTFCTLLSAPRGAIDVVDTN